MAIVFQEVNQVHISKITYPDQVSHEVRDVIRRPYGRAIDRNEIPLLDQVF